MPTASSVRPEFINFSIDRAAMADIEAMLSELHADAEAQSTLTFAERVEGTGSFIPPFIRVDEGEIPIGATGLAVLAKLTNWVRTQFPWADARLEPDSLAFIVKQSAGEVLARATDGPTERSFASEFLKAMEQALVGTQVDIDWLVPCHVFHADQAAPSFEIGPIAFWPRNEWLAQTNYSFDKSLAADYWSSKIDLGELDARAWAAGTRTRERLAGAEVAKLLANHPWVAVVSISKHEVLRSERKAEALIVLGLNIVGLACGPNNAAGLVAAGQERRTPHRRRLGFALDGGMVGGVSSDVPGAGGEPESATKFLKNANTTLAKMGTLLSTFLAITTESSRPHLLERWIDAVYWFGLAAREPLDFMALVAYGNAIDIASGAGGKVKEMAQFAGLVLGLEPEKPIRADGLTLREALNAVYNRGRSFLSHGDESGLLADNRAMRRLAHDLARYTLSRVAEPLTILVADSHPMLQAKKKDATKEFIAWLRQRASISTGSAMSDEEDSSER